MRHRIKGRKLNRAASHRKALIRNLANQLFEHKEIKTTTAKAKEARITIERLITYAKKGDTHHRRLAFGFLRQKETIKTLFDEIAPVFAERQGGYTRVIKLGRRQGDGAPMAILQLVDFEALGDSGKPEKKKKTKKKQEKSVDQEVKDTKQEDKAREKPQTLEIEKTEEKVSSEIEEEKLAEEETGEDPTEKALTDDSESDEEKKDK